MIALFSTPESWAWVTLGEIAEVVGGVTKDSKKQSDPSLPKVPYLRVANVQRGYLDLSEISEIRVPQSTVKKLRLEPGDVLLNEGGDRDKLGRGWVWQGQVPDCIHQNHVFRARLTGTLHPKLLAWYANGLAREWFDQNASQSVNLASISLSTIKRLPVPVPPVNEQRLIVQTLEDYLSRLETAGEILFKGRVRAQRLRSSILDDAISKIERAPMRSLGSILREPLRNGHSTRSSRDGSGVRTLTLSAVTNNEFSDRYTKMTVASPDRVTKLWLEPGDIFIQRSNTSELVGTSALYSGMSDWAIFPDLLIRVRVASDFLPEYVQLILCGKRARGYMKSSAKGLSGSMPKIDQGTIQNLEIPVIPKLDQKSFVEEVRALRNGTRRLEVALECAFKRQENLRRAVLSEAFAGRLVAQDPAYEAAPSLLESFQPARMAQGSAPRIQAETSGAASQKEALS
jgi:restriction endonuclease S subunit